MSGFEVLCWLLVGVISVYVGAAVGIGIYSLIQYGRWNK